MIVLLAVGLLVMMAVGLSVFVLVLAWCGGRMGSRGFAAIAAMPTLVSSIALGVWLAIREAPMPGDLFADMEIALWCVLQLMVIVAVMVGGVAAMLVHGAIRWLRWLRQRGAKAAIE